MLILLVLISLVFPLSAGSQVPSYWVYVGAESADLIHRVRFTPGCAAANCAVVVKTIPIGDQAAEMEGPHGLAISRDGKYLYMTTGHGMPDGKYWKYVLGPDTLAGAGILLGNFPASIDVTPDGLYTLSANFNLHGEMVPSSVSVVYTPTNTEVARITTCTMPHGSRVSPDGMLQYSTCMMDDQLVEIDTRTFKLSRKLALGKEHAMNHHSTHMATCSPTWAQPSIDGSKIFVACNKSDEIMEVDRESWTATRRFKTGRGVYNLDATRDGKLLVASLKQGAMTEIFDIATGKSLAQIKTSNKVAHGITTSPDSRYAFVTSEGVGSEPGKVDVYDLKALKHVGTADVGQQASGIAFWKMEPQKLTAHNQPIKP
jgi:DNA-binding beta-propeller fold protein YncE